MTTAIISSSAAPGAVENNPQAYPAPGDWPMWKYDAKRTAASPEPLAPDLRLLWTRHLPAPRRAWPAQRDDRDKLEFDLSYSPVAMGGRIFVASMNADSLTAYNIEDGAEAWRFYADGPMRLAPAAWNGNVYCVSDDGRLYCLDAASGALRWKFDAAPSDRRVLGNTRVISAWPARGGPVIQGGKVYFSAGIWPFMGVFIYALNAETGEVVWANTGTGAQYQQQPHPGAFAFAGVAPQGYLAAAGERLIVSGGRSPPAVLDLKTGELLHSLLFGNVVGGYKIQTDGESYYNHGKKYKISDSAVSGDSPVDIISDGVCFSGGKETINAVSVDGDTLWKLPVQGLHALHVKAGSRLCASGANGAIIAIELGANESDEPVSDVVELADRVDGPIFNMLTASGRLFAITEKGTLCCFAPAKDGAPVAHEYAPKTAATRADAAQCAQAILERCGAPAGYALFLGAGDGDLIESMAAASALHIVGVDADHEKIAKLRRRFDDAGLYGGRIALLTGAPAQAHLPPYIFSLIVAEDPGAAGLTADKAGLERVYSLLRPYGGKAFLCVAPQNQDAFLAAAAGLDPTAAIASRNGFAFLELTRAGPLPGAGQWTHQYANSANTVMSGEDNVRLPMGLLWFGGPGNTNALPRHARGPRPQVAGGRLVILGVETISARDVYTGRELWVREFPGIGHAFTDMNLESLWLKGASVYMINQPGAVYIGSPYVTLPDSVYLRYDRKIFRIDPDSGKTLAEFPVPAGDDDEEMDWGHISVYDDLLVTTVSPHFFDTRKPGGTNWNAASSGKIAVLDRFTGDELWTYEADIGIRHNAIASGAGKIFVIDGLSREALGFLMRRGAADPDGFGMVCAGQAGAGADAAEKAGLWKARLMAFDARSGETLWETEDKVFGTFLSYSEQHDILLEGGNSDVRQPLPDEPSGRMCARRGKDGSLLWSKPVGATPAAINGEDIIPARAGSALSLLIGQAKTRLHPLTSQTIPWTYTRSYGCGAANAGRHLLLFRSAAAGFTDLETGCTGNFGGFKSGCTVSMIPADGVVNAPDYTRTCNCSYQNQTSLAMIHDPDVELWTYSSLPDPAAGIRRVGINFGAPGARQAEDGVLWIEHPLSDGGSPKFEVGVATNENSRIFRKHSLFVKAGNGGHAWVAASGIEGVLGAWVSDLEPDGANGAASYTVKMHFSEPRRIGEGERVFDIILQGEPVAEDFDIVKQAGSPDTSLVVEFQGVRALDGGGVGAMEIEFDSPPESAYPAVLCGLEILLED